MEFVVGGDRLELAPGDECMIPVRRGCMERYARMPWLLPSRDRSLLQL